MEITEIIAGIAFALGFVVSTGAIAALVGIATRGSLRSWWES